MSHYDFSKMEDVFCFSDVEGDMPDELFKKTCQVLNDETTSIVFTGDLIDRGPKSYFLMRHMLSLKEYAPKRVILIVGNRDINKLRVGFECWVPALVGDIKKCKNKMDVWALAQKNADTKHQFMLDNTVVRGTLNDEKVWDLSGVKNASNDTNYDISLGERVRIMYTNTMGAQHHPMHAFTELIGNQVEWKNMNEVYTFLGIMNMIMGFIWTDHQFGEELLSFNGLHLKYLRNCHIMATFEFDKCFGFASHSGIPYKQEEPDKFVFADVDIQSRNGKFDELMNTILKIRADVNPITTIYQSGEFKNVMKMSANCGKDLSKSSPIVGLTSIIDYGPVKWQHANNADADANVNMLQTIAETIAKSTAEPTTYLNIFGHQPCGYSPIVGYIQQNGINIYSTCLDVSKAEHLDNASKRAYALLHLNNTKTETKTETMTIMGYVDGAIEGAIEARLSCNYEVPIVNFVQTTNNQTNTIVSKIHIIGDVNIYTKYERKTEKGFPIPYLKIEHVGENSGGPVVTPGGGVKAVKAVKKNQTKASQQHGPNAIKQFLNKKKKINTDI
jgi:hypothetical protein